MTSHNILTERREQLKEIIKGSFETAPSHSKAFALRITEMRKFQEILPDKLCPTLYVSSKYIIHYGGFPDTACLGFAIARTPLAQISQETVDTFIAGMRRLQARSGDSLDDLASDDIAILGLADGVFKLLKIDEDQLQDAKTWLLANVLSKDSSNNIWSNRLRVLAGDLLDGLGRLRTPISQNDVDRLALELSIRPVWSEQFRHASYPNHKVCQNLLTDLLTLPAPTLGDLDRSIIWLIALDRLIAETVDTLIPKTSDTIRILENTQHSFKRWVWDKQARRRNVDAAHWLIDNEPHVQSFLWSILYPIYGDDLVDETYLPGYGQVQSRADLGIISLKLIIEVKFLRKRADFAKVEEEVAGDLGLYFKCPEKFDQMIVYVYDDCDTQYVECYDDLKNALRNRERIEEVIIVRRPSMIPNRNERGKQKE